MRHLLSDLLPPALMRIYRNLTVEAGYFGDYPIWADAASASVGYDSELILNKVKEALLKVKSGEAVYERDSVLFDDIEYSWPLLAGLLWAASLNGNRLDLVDFGGSLGSSYYQNRRFLEYLQELRWNVVEQERFVECGRRYFEDDRLRFYRDIDECLKGRKPGTILLSSVLQYLEKPYELLAKVLEFRFEVVIVDRTPFLGEGDDRITVQKVPPEIYDASYPAWFFNLERFLSFFSAGYELMADFETADRSNIPSTYKGFIFRLRQDEALA